MSSQRGENNCETLYTAIDPVGSTPSSAGQWSSSRNRDLQPPGDRDRRKKPEELPPILARIAATKERLQERKRKSCDLDHGHHKGSRDFPESCLRKMLVPEDLPASDGASVGAKKIR